MMRSITFAACLLSQWILLDVSASPVHISEPVMHKLRNGERLDRHDKHEIERAERIKYMQLRRSGVDEVSHTAEAATLRNFRLRSKKQKGWFFWRRHVSLAQTLFPWDAPREYSAGEAIPISVEQATSKRAIFPLKYYDLPPVCRVSRSLLEGQGGTKRTLGDHLVGHEFLRGPFPEFEVKQDIGCTPLCTVRFSGDDLKRTRQLIDGWYRVQLYMDKMPVLMRSKELNYVVPGYPLGFRAPAHFEPNLNGNYFLYNHLKFLITYQEDPSQFQGVRIIGFDVQPVSFQHQVPKGPGVGNGPPHLSKCAEVESLGNDPSTFLVLGMSPQTDTHMDVSFSYEVEWVQSELLWEDRWDVYILGLPDDNIHYYGIVNSAFLVVLLASACIHVYMRKIRKEIADYNEMESGWKVIRNDMLRTPHSLPSALPVLVGIGCYIGTAVAATLLSATFGLFNPMETGEFWTVSMLSFCVCGGSGSYLCRRLCDSMGFKDWMSPAFWTANALVGLVIIVALHFDISVCSQGATTCLDPSVALLVAAWAGLAVPSVYLGTAAASLVGHGNIAAGNTTAGIPGARASTRKNKANALLEFPYSPILCGSAICWCAWSEFPVVMASVWLSMYNYQVGFWFVQFLCITATSGMVSALMTYLKLRSEDPRWWWSAFYNTAAGGVFAFLLSFMYLSNSLNLVGVGPNAFFLTAMLVVSVGFGLVCGSAGFLASLAVVLFLYNSVPTEGTEVKDDFEYEPLETPENDAG